MVLKRRECDKCRKILTEAHYSHKQWRSKVKPKCRDCTGNHERSVYDEWRDAGIKKEEEWEKMNPNGPERVQCLTCYAFKEEHEFDHRNWVHHTHPECNACWKPPTGSGIDNYPGYNLVLLDYQKRMAKMDIENSSRAHKNELDNYRCQPRRCIVCGIETTIAEQMERTFVPEINGPCVIRAHTGAYHRNHDYYDDGWSCCNSDEPCGYEVKHTLH